MHSHRTILVKGPMVSKASQEELEGLAFDQQLLRKIGVHATVDSDRLLFVQDRFLIVIRDLSGATDPMRRTMLVNWKLSMWRARCG